jgi:hypothetical protein
VVRALAPRLASATPWSKTASASSGWRWRSAQRRAYEAREDGRVAGTRGERPAPAPLGDLLVGFVGEQVDACPGGLQPAAEILLIVPRHDRLVGRLQVAGGVVPAPLVPEDQRRVERGQAGRRVVGRVALLQSRPGVALRRPRRYATIRTPMAASAGQDSPASAPCPQFSTRDSPIW